MENFSFKVNRKLSLQQVGGNKFRFVIDKSGTTEINITQDKIEDVIYSVFDGSDDLDLLRILTNIKGKQKVPKIYFEGINGDDELVPDQGCGFHDTTTLVLADVDIEVEKREMGLEMCLDDLVNSSLEVYITPGARNESITIEDGILAYFTKRLKRNVNRFAYGDATNGVLNKILTNGTQFTPSLTAPTDILTELYNAMPYDWQTAEEAEPVIFISPNFMTLVRSEIKNATAPITSAIEVINNRFKLPLTNALVVTTPSLTDTKAVAGIANYLFLATDLESDFADTRVWYNPDSGKIRFQAKLYLGTTVADIDNFIYYVDA